MGFLIYVVRIFAKTKLKTSGSSKKYQYFKQATALTIKSHNKLIVSSIVFNTVLTYSTSLKSTKWLLRHIDSE